MDGRIIFGQWRKNLKIGFYQNIFFTLGNISKEKADAECFFFRLGRF
jgi:hypothetical protein